MSSALFLVTIIIIAAIVSNIKISQYNTNATFFCQMSLSKPIFCVYTPSDVLKRSYCPLLLSLKFNSLKALEEESGRGRRSRSVAELRDWSAAKLRNSVGGAVKGTIDWTYSEKGRGQLSCFSTGVLCPHFIERRQQPHRGVLFIYLL